MSEIDIVLLGMLKKKPQSAYDLQKAVDYRNISYWVKISNPSIYKNVRQLELKGYIQGQPVKNGNMAEKKVFSVTEAGMQYLKNEMKVLSKKEIRLFQDMNAVILHLDIMDDDYKQECLSNIYSQILLLKSHMNEKMKERKDVLMPFSGRMIIEQQEELIDVLEKWIEKYMANMSIKQTLDNENNGGYER